MGILIKKSIIPEDYSQLIIYLSEKRIVSQPVVSFSLPFSEEMIKISPERRNLYIESCISRVLDQYPPYTVFKDIDALFNPCYKIDVLYILVNLYKQKKYSLLWSGRFIDRKLLYADEGYSDYKIFDISKYDIICVM